MANAKKGRGPNCFHAQILWIVILVKKINFFSLQLMAHDLIAALDEMYENKKFSKVWQMSSLINQRFSSLFKIQCTIYKCVTMLMIHFASCCVVSCTVSLAFYV